MKNGKESRPFGKPIVVGFAYCVFSMAWIFLTDKLLGSLHLSPQRTTQWSMSKGLFYVVVSGGLIYFVLKQLQRVTVHLEDMVATRTAALAQKQEVLQKQADILKTLIEGAPAGLAMLDRNMRYLEVSSRWCKDYGLDRASILGKSHRSVFPDLPERWEEIHRRGLAGEVLHSERDSFTDPTGKEHWLRWEIRPWGDAGTETGGIIIFTEDITEQRLLEHQLRQAQKMEAVGELAGGVAHDFNNLLMVIRTSTELLKESATDPEKVTRHADRVLHASDRAASVTKQLLAFSRKQPQNLTVVDINSVVTDCCKMLPTLLGEDIEFVSTPMATPGVVQVDPSQIEQVIVNLVVNARDAMPRGGRLVLETSVAELDDEASRHRGTEIPPGRYVVLSVTDTGCGMDKATQERIFEPFFTTKAVGKGTGLGLSTVYGIVKQSRGFIWVYSEIGQGTTFRIYLPQIQAPLAKAPVPNLTPHPANGDATVLLVEDQPALREVMREYLQACGFNILPAEDGKAALQMAETRKDPIHVVLTDVVMPGIRGTEVARRIVEIHPEARVICMSGYSGHVLESDGLPNATFIQKPIDLRSLAAKIHDVLRPS